MFLMDAPHGAFFAALSEVGVCMCQGGSTCQGAGSRAKCSTGSMSNIFSNLEAGADGWNWRDRWDAIGKPLGYRGMPCFFLGELDWEMCFFFFFWACQEEGEIEAEADSRRLSRGVILVTFYAIFLLKEYTKHPEE